MGPPNLTILLVPVPFKATKVSALKNYIGYAFWNLLFLRESTMAYGVVVKNMNLKKMLIDNTCSEALSRFYNEYVARLYFLGLIY